MIFIELQPRAKSRVFACVDIRPHPLPVAFHLFLPQICHSDFCEFYMLKIIDRLLVRSKIQHSYEVRTSRLTRDGRSAIQVSHGCY